MFTPEGRVRKCKRSRTALPRKLFVRLHFLRIPCVYFYIINTWAKLRFINHNLWFFGENCVSTASNLCLQHRDDSAKMQVFAHCARVAWERARECACARNVRPRAQKNLARSPIWFASCRHPPNTLKYFSVLTLYGSTFASWWIIWSMPICILFAS